MCPSILRRWLVCWTVHVHSECSCPAGSCPGLLLAAVPPAVLVPPGLVQAAFLEALAAEGEEGWAAGEAAVAPLLRRKPDLAAEAAALAKAKGEGGVRPRWPAAGSMPGAAIALLPGPLLPCWRPCRCRRCNPATAQPSVLAASGPLARVLLATADGDGERQAALVAELLPVYCDKVLSAKERSSPAALACWGALAAAASEEQVAATLLPTVVRMTKRNPEPALAAAAPMLAALRCGAAGAGGRLRGAGGAVVPLQGRACVGSCLARCCLLRTACAAACSVELVAMQSPRCAMLCCAGWT